MMHKAKVAVCSDMSTKHSTQSEQFSTWWYVKEPLGVKRLTFYYLPNIYQYIVCH